jgi:hypothetical protein
MFNLVTDALVGILDKAQAQGYIRGMAPHLMGGTGSLTHLQYADDTILMCEGDERSIKNMKFLLYCFEWLSRLKINYHKSEVVTFGIGEEEEEKIANMLNCGVGRLPMKYLGFPISDSRLGVNAFKDIVEKMRRKLQPWRGRHLTSRGRAILTNSSLSSMPIYTMGIYLMHENTHQKMDAIRSKFFWGSDGEKFRYHMVKWENMCLPRHWGGRIINKRVLNEALLLKWVWRLHTRDENDMCSELLRNKYLKDGVITKCKMKGGSQFWQ